MSEPAEVRPWWRRIPGFRTKTRWKMVVATICYLILFNGIFNIVQCPAPSTSPSESLVEVRTGKQIVCEDCGSIIEDSTYLRRVKESEAANYGIIEERQGLCTECARAKVIAEATTKITYAMAEKSPDDLKGKAVKWWGRVFNIREEKETTFFQAFYQDGWDAFAVFYDGKLPEVFNDDKVEVIGTLSGLMEGYNAFGAKISQPRVEAIQVTKLR